MVNYSGHTEPKPISVIGRERSLCPAVWQPVFAPSLRQMTLADSFIFQRPDPEAQMSNSLCSAPRHAVWSLGSWGEVTAERSAWLDALRCWLSGFACGSGDASSHLLLRVGHHGFCMGFAIWHGRIMWRLKESHGPGLIYSLTGERSSSRRVCVVTINFSWPSEAEMGSPSKGNCHLLTWFPPAVPSAMELGFLVGTGRVVCVWVSALCFHVPFI